MPEWSTACPDWAEKLKHRRGIIPAPIYPAEAAHALSIFKQQRVVDLPRTVWDNSIGDSGDYRSPNFGECSEQWVFDFVAAIFGAYDSESGRQLIREFYLLISKKNTKSTIAAGIMMTALILCWRDDEEHLILAPTKEVADNSFKPAAGMVRADEELLGLFLIQDHIRTITHRVNKASLKVVAADTDTVSGKKSGRVLVDEHWLFGKKANADAMFMEATGGQISREEGWVIYLTTQSDEPPAGVFKEKLDYYRNVRDGKILDNKSLGVLYEFPDDMVEAKAYLQPENFHITNPNIGRSVSAEWLEDQLKKFQHKTDGTYQKFLAKHLDIEIGLNLRNDRWAGADHWQACADSVQLDDLLARSEVAVVGIDGGGLDDLLGLSVLGRCGQTKRMLHWGHAWAHKSVFSRRPEIAERLRDFEHAGDLTVVQVAGQDVEDVADIVAQCEAAGVLDRVGVDPAGIGAIVDAIVDRKIEHDRIVGIPQGWRMVGAIKTAERWLVDGRLRHGGQPLMAWSVSNAKLEQRGNAVLITKQVSGSGKIDPLMALLNSVALMAMNPKPRKARYQMLFL